MLDNIQYSFYLLLPPYALNWPADARARTTTMLIVSHDCDHMTMTMPVQECVDWTNTKVHDIL